MFDFLILNAKVINQGTIQDLDLALKNGRIEKIGKDLSNLSAQKIIDAKDHYLMPGVIDDQVHFREPGLTSKASIYTESRAAVAGGTTSFMEMPNTNPATLNQTNLQKKYDIAAQDSLANYSFYMGASNDNIEEVLKTDSKKVCGIKVFMGSSTGNMLVDNPNSLEKIFSHVEMLIATHCEDETVIKNNISVYKNKYPKAKASIHPTVRSSESCYLSSQKAIELAKKFGSRLHVLHISTAKEIELFDNQGLLKDKKITSEACVHHLWFNEEDYHIYDNQIKCNPAIKTKHDQNSILKGLLKNKIDIIATDHAPHTSLEKKKPYWQAPSGVPLVQHSLIMMLEFYKQGKLSLEKIVEKMCHAPSICFKIEDRGWIKEGYWADLVIFNLKKKTTITQDNIEYKCKWSPFLNHTFNSQIIHTFVSGHLSYSNGLFYENKKGKRLTFNLQ